MHRSVCRQFAMDEETGLWVWFPATSAILHKAAARMNTMDRAVFVRAADAIHLTCAAEHGFTEIYSSDRHLLAAASAFRLKPRNVIR
jgi:predicted nucleic acid-binding protein